MSYSKSYLLLLIIIVLMHCTPKTIPYSYHRSDESTEEEVEIQEEKVEVIPKDIFADFSVDSIQSCIREMVNSIESNEFFQIDLEYIFSKNVLPEMYRTGNFNLHWYDNKNRLDGLTCLEMSWADGLEPNDYHLDKLQSLREDILSNTFLDYKEIAEFDILLTDGLLLYAYHLIKGKINPYTLDINWNFSSRDIPQKPTKLFLDALENKSIAETIYGLRPQYHIYNQYIDQIIRYQKIKENGGWPEVLISKVIKPGELSRSVNSIRKRLEITEDIEHKDAFNDSLYDDDLVEGIKKFQNRHGLNPDGVIGKNTVDMLNISIDKKIEEIKINMERARWVLNDISNDMILVNIANFKLFYFRDSLRVHETKVMVGTYYNQTPIFKSKMKYLVFNPTWTVPYSIATKETLPKLKKDQNYLAERNMSLINKNGKIISQSSIDWSQVTESNFPFTIRQEPGPGNALGQVKFIFPNEYSVYLHDTPSKYLFAKEERAFSHGCIRVENPLVLAQILLNDEKWDRARIKEVLAEKKEKIVHLKNPLDVLLLYWTSGFLENGDIFFIKDVYNRNPKILEGLQNQDWEKLMRDYQEEIKKSASLN